MVLGIARIPSLSPRHSTGGTIKVPQDGVNALLFPRMVAPICVCVCVCVRWRPCVRVLACVWDLGFRGSDLVSCSWWCGCVGWEGGAAQDS